MAKIQDVAKLDEKTVQKIAAGEVKPSRRKPLAVVQPTFASPVVRQEIWLAVKAIVADPDNSYTRWEILDENTMVIR